jgi:hypothetical protein
MVEARFARLCEKGGAKRDGEAPAEPTNSIRARKNEDFHGSAGASPSQGLQESLDPGNLKASRNSAKATVCHRTGAILLLLHPQWSPPLYVRT